jgi:hypothetical protein
MSRSARRAHDAAHTGLTEHATTSDQHARLIRDLGLPGLFDIHTHFMPPRLLEKIQAYFEAGRPLVGEPWPILYKQSEPDRLALLRSFGVRRFTALSYPHKPGMAGWLNDWSADFAARNRDCVPCATFYCEPDAVAYVEQALASGARLFKSHLQVGNYDPLDPMLASVWGLLADSGTPVVVHCGSAPAPGPHTGPEPIAKLLASYPNLTIVIAHFGQPEYESFLAMARQYDRLYLDTTLVFTDFMQRRWPFPSGAIPQLRDLAHRILLGSDFPNIPHPYWHQIECLVDLDLGDAWLRGVLHDNASRLLSDHHA